MDSRSLTPHEAGYCFQEILFFCSNDGFGSFTGICEGKQDLSNRATEEVNVLQNNSLHTSTTWWHKLLETQLAGGGGGAHLTVASSTFMKDALLSSDGMQQTLMLRLLAELFQESASLLPAAETRPGSTSTVF